MAEYRECHTGVGMLLWLLQHPLQVGKWQMGCTALWCGLGGILLQHKELTALPCCPLSSQYLWGHQRWAGRSHQHCAWNLIKTKETGNKVYPFGPRNNHHETWPLWHQRAHTSEKPDYKQHWGRVTLPSLTQNCSLHKWPQILPTDHAAGTTSKKLLKVNK